MDKIFVQIASYRDPELKNTIADLLNKAAQPERLNICIAWQHSPDDEWDHLNEYQNDSRFNILDINYKESEGACWARNKIQQEYKGEEYTLQLDSHHRFVENWDEECIGMIKQLQAKGHTKPLLTSYVSSYDPKNDPEGRVQVPWKMNFDRFTPEGIVFFLPAAIDNFEELTEPIPARFYSGHFTFTVGQFAEEVQHDPSFYFHGEEITIAVRAFTHGYDLFHPHKLIAWHEYTRVGRTKQWDDDPVWHERNTRTHRKVRQLLGVDETPCTPCSKNAFGKYYLGEVRTLEDYQNYAGIRFTDRAVQQSTLDFKLPPNNPSEEYVHRFKHILNIRSDWFPQKDKYIGIGIFFEKEDGSLLYRTDIQGSELTNVLSQENYTKHIEFMGEHPFKWVAWAYSNEGWHERLDFNLNT